MLLIQLYTAFRCMVNHKAKLYLNFKRLIKVFKTNSINFWPVTDKSGRRGEGNRIQYFVKKYYDPVFLRYHIH